MIQEKISFTFKGKNYESLPLIAGRVIDYYKQRTFAAGGTYSMMFRDLEVPAKILTMVNLNAFLYVFCPKFLEDIKPATIEEMGIQDYMDIVSIYETQINPFIESLSNFLSNKDTAVEDKKVD